MGRGLIRLCRTATLVSAAFIVASCSGNATLYLLHNCGAAITVAVTGGDADDAGEVTVMKLEPGVSTNVRSSCCDPKDDLFTVKANRWTGDVHANDYSLAEPFELPVEACES